MTDIAKAAQESSDLALWQAYCEKKMALEDAADEIERLRAECQRLADEIERLRADLAEAIDQRNAADFVLASALKMSERRSAERDAARVEAARLRALLIAVEKVMRRVQDWGNARDTELADLTCQEVRAALVAKEPGHD